MTTRQQQITELFLRQEIIDVILNTAKGDSYYYEELKGEVFVILCEMTDEKLDQEYKNGIQKYIGGICKNLFKSNTSKFYKTIKRPRKTIEVGIIENVAEEKSNYQELLDNTVKEVSKLPAYDKVIIDLLVEGYSIKEIALKTGVNRVYISEAVRRIRTELKSKIRKNL